MRLSAVVVIANMAGCVCQPKDEGVRTGTAAEAGSAAVAGGAAIALAVARSRQSQETTEQLMITAAPTF